MFVLNHHLCLLVFIVGMFTPDEATKHCPPLMTFALTQDTVLEGHIVATLKVEERTWCEHHCIREPRCRSFNYQIDETVNAKERICQLSSSSILRHPGQAKKRPGWLYEEVLESNVERACSSETSLGAFHGGDIKNSSFSATSFFSEKYLAVYGRLQSGHCGWVPKKKVLTGEYLQIDLGKMFWICGVATQGANSNCSFSEWTTKYKISLSVDNSTWNIYQSNGSDKIFDANTDCCTVVKNLLLVPTKARYIRFIPTAYHNFPALRVDVFGQNV